MTLDKPVYSVKAGARLIKRQRGAPYMAECLGDNGQSYSKKYPGYIYVREILSADPDSGGISKGETYLVLAHRNFKPGYGVRVWVEYVPHYDEWVIDENDPFSLVEQGINPAILNPNNPWAKTADLDSLGPLLTYAVANGNTPTTEVAIKNFIYMDYLGATKLYRMDGTNRPDIADYAPAADLKRLVHLWLNPNNTISVSQSTPIDSASAFQIDIDLAEVLEARPNQLATPIGAWIMKNGDTSIGPDDFYCNTRPWLNTAQYAGFPNPVERNYIVPSGVTETVCGSIYVTSPASLTVQGTLYVL